jgi:hypothetical protein
MPVKFRLAALVAELAAAAALLAHWPLADDADVAVILLEASDAAEGVARLVSFTPELATAAGVTAAATNKSGRVEFKGVRGQIHRVSTFQGLRREGAPDHSGRPLVERSELLRTQRDGSLPHTIHQTPLGCC